MKGIRGIDPGLWVRLRLIGYMEARIDLMPLAGGLLLLLAGPGRLALENRHADT